MENLTGKQFGPYQVVAPLGEGGMAAVYKGYQPGIDRYVALKVLPRHFASDPQFTKRFEQEAKVLAKLQHPHILPIHDYGQAEGYTYIVMPFIESGDLTDVIRSQGSLPLAEIKRIISQVGDALDYAHAQGVIHRDIKPSNILVDQRGNCLLTDFGIAKMVEGTSDKLTVTGGIVGTPTYMSPEQGTGKSLDGRSDIYALGVILYEMITGRVPFRAETPMAVMVKHINDPLLPPREFNEHLPEAIERVVLKSLAKKPEDRYGTASEMIDALQGAIDSNPTIEEATTLSSKPRLKPKPAPATPAAVPQPRAGRTDVMLAATIFLLIILLGLVGVGGWWLFNPTAAAPAPSPPPPTAAPPQPTSTPALALPPPTEAPDSEAGQPTPSPTPVVLPTEPPVNTQPPPEQADPAQTEPGQAPPAEAINACGQLSEGASCQFSTRLGTVNGTCQRVLTQEIACVPAGGPPGPRN